MNRNFCFPVVYKWTENCGTDLAIRFWMNLWCPWKIIVSYHFTSFFIVAADILTMYMRDQCIFYHKIYNFFFIMTYANLSNIMAELYDLQKQNEHSIIICIYEMHNKRSIFNASYSNGTLNASLRFKISCLLYILQVMYYSIASI